MAGSHPFYLLSGPPSPRGLHPLRAKPNDIFIFPENVPISAFYVISDPHLVFILSKFVCYTVILVYKSTHLCVVWWHVSASGLVQ